MAAKIKLSKEMAENEVKSFLEAHYIDVDTDDMEEDEAETTKAIISSLARPVINGRAVIDGKKYELTLLEAQGEMKSVTFAGMTFHSLTYSSRAKAGDNMAIEGQVVAAMVNITYAELCKMQVQDFMILNNIKKLFMSA